MNQPATGPSRASTRRLRRTVKRHLQDQSHSEFVYRSFHLHESGYQFIGSHEETLSITMHVHNPNTRPSDQWLVIFITDSAAPVGRWLQSFWVSNSNVLRCVSGARGQRTTEVA
jgi:hypothetical protein